MTVRNVSEKQEHRGGGARLSRHKMILAAACGGMIGTSAAQAATVSEPPDFGDSFGAATVLPGGTNQIEGSVEAGSLGNPIDFARFNGLIPSASIDIDYAISNVLMGGETSISLVFFNSGGGTIGSVAINQASPASGQVGVTVPLDGSIVAQVNFQAYDSDPTLDYTISFDESALQEETAIPEPTSAAIAGLGAATLLARRRRD
jgi:hypothetical protein